MATMATAPWLHSCSLRSDQARSDMRPGGSGRRSEHDHRRMDESAAGAADRDGPEVRCAGAGLQYGVMDAGIHLPLIDFGGGGFSYRRLAETVNAARECGFAAVSANDHFLFPVPWLDGLTALAAVAERSGGLTLMTTVALVTLRGAVPLAKALSALDVVSGGRVIAGLGPGSSRADYQAVGVSFEQRWQRFDTAVRLIKAMLQPGPAPGRCRAGREAVAAAPATPRDPAVDRELGLAGGLAPGGQPG